ncbi:cupin domain-containing protein [Streptomyces sp. G45]|uniref:cupin domain-containing protein n=1 Tax=Streptomyces sp. G45 TaxID=3406627 RepID=UPI003C140FA0
MGHDPHPNPPVRSTVVAENYDRWSPPLLKDFEDNAHNGRVGRTLVAETDAVRVWETTLQPGERVPMHRHVLDYSWTALTDGRARQHAGDGTSREISYARGQSLFFRFDAGEHHLHDLRNIGDEPLSFLVVELKEGANKPLDLP